MLDDDGDSLAVSYQLPDSCSEITVETCLSPHYYRLLRHGAADCVATRCGLAGGPQRRGRRLAGQRRRRDHVGR